MPATAEKLYTPEEVAKHRDYEDCWVILGEKGERKVYDITSFLDDHPGTTARAVSWLSFR